MGLKKNPGLRWLKQHKQIKGRDMRGQGLHNLVFCIYGEDGKEILPILVLNY